MKPVGAPGATLNNGISSFSPPLGRGKSPVDVNFRTPLHIAEKRRPEAPPEVVAAAEGMEAMFLNHLMKVMRESVPKNDMDLESPATEIYRGLLDTEIADRAAKGSSSGGQGIGLAEQIIAYLDSRSYHSRDGGQVSAPSQSRDLTVQEVPHVDSGQSAASSTDTNR